MRRKGEKILAILLILQFVMFMGLGTYVQNTYAEEPVNNQIEKTEQYQDEDSNDLEDVQEEKKTEEKKTETKVQMETNEELIKTRTERDIFKKLYEQMTERLLER